MNIRDAVDDDAAGIAEIYNDAVLNGCAIWNDTAVDAEDRRRWIKDHQRNGFPVLVAVENRAVVGYAAIGPYRDFDGYRHTVENSVYVRDGQRGKGIGRVLLAALCDRARACGVHVMIAAIEAGNTGSIRLHEDFGFERVGLLKEVGFKFGTWLDLAFLQLTFEEEAPR